MADAQSGQDGGGRRARMAVGVGVAFACLLLGGWLLLGGARESARRHACSQQLSAIACACFMYADAPANNGYYPSRLSDLYRAYVADTRVFTSPARGIRALQANEIDAQGDYVIVPGLSYSSTAGHILMYERHSHPGGLVHVVRAGNTSSELMTVADLRQQLSSQGAAALPDQGDF